MPYTQRLFGPHQAQRLAAPETSALAHGPKCAHPPDRWRQANPAAMSEKTGTPIRFEHGRHLRATGLSWPGFGKKRRCEQSPPQGGEPGAAKVAPQGSGNRIPQSRTGKI
jgi:hypothetical protein